MRAAWGRSSSAGGDPDGAGADDLLALDREGAVGERERRSDAVDARARLDPVARLCGLQEVDREADGGTRRVVLGVVVDRPAEREVGEGRQEAALHGAAMIRVTLLGAQPERELVAALLDVDRPDVLEERALVGERREAGGDVHRGGQGSGELGRAAAATRAA